MTITEVVVSAGRTFNHPYENYSNLRPEVTLKATIDDGDDPVATTKLLQAKAEGLVEDHKTGLLQNLREIAEMQARDREIARLEQLLTTSQARLADLRSGRTPRLADGDAVGD